MSSASLVSHFSICITFVVLIANNGIIKANKSASEQNTEIGSPGSDSNNKELRQFIRSVCDGTADKPLTSISRVRSFVNYIEKRKRIVACERYNKAFVELDPILKIAQSGKVCDLHLVGLIRNYHNEFIRNDKDGKKEDNIPKALRHFFMALCFQIDAECKMSFINNLEQDTKEYITEKDYYSVIVLEEMGATLLDNESIGDFDDIVLLNDLKLVEEGVNINLMIKARTSELFQELLRNCKTKFKPIYDKLIIPLIELSNLGYNYQGELLARELDELKTNELVLRWYNIVQICESFSAFIIYEDPDIKLPGNSQMVTFINAEEAKDLEARRIKSVAEQLEADKNFKRIQYEPLASLNDDQLWIVGQEELNKLIAKLKASASEENRVRNRLIKKLFHKIIKSFTSGQVFVFASDLIKNKMGRNSKDAPIREINEEMIKLFDEAVVKFEGIDKNTPAVSSRLSKIDRHASSPRQLSYRGKIPSKSDIPETVNGSKLSVKLYDGIIGRLAMSKGDLFFTILLVIGFGLVILAVALTASG